MLPDLGFVYGVDVLVVVVGSVQVVSGTGCAVLAWRYSLQPGGVQTETETAAN